MRLAGLWFAATEAVCLGATVIARQRLAIIPDAFSDIYMLAVIWVAYKCSWKWGLVSLASSLAMAFYLLLPIDNSDVFSITSFGVSGLVVVGVMRAASRSRAS
jgi:hypothetical protein